MAFATARTLRPSRDHESSAYLTDGSRLYRVTSRFAYPPEESFATLEDCVTLEVSSYCPDELWEMGLRLVRA